jgi:uncharacterized membrane protein
MNRHRLPGRPRTEMTRKQKPATAALERITPQQRAILNAVPGSWLDSLLTGPNAVIGNPPYDCRDVEALLHAVRDRVRSALLSPPRRAGDQ